MRLATMPVRRLAGDWGDLCWMPPAQLQSAPPRATPQTLLRALKQDAARALAVRYAALQGEESRLTHELEALPPRFAENAQPAARRLPSAWPRPSRARGQRGL